MKAAQGYYSLIQYCPDLSRLEAVNVGVLLFCPDPHFINARTTRSVQRIRRFFGSEDRDWDQIREMITAIEDRLTTEGERYRTRDDLERFVATRGNAVQLTPPRPMKVHHPVQDLEALFQRLVGGDGTRRREVQPIARRLEESLTQEGVAPLVRRDVTVTVPAFRRPLTVPFAYRNGRVNLILPAAFRQERPSGTINQACRHAVEGRSLYEHPDERLGELQLLLVADFPPGQNEVKAVVQDILHENRVRLLTLPDLPRLVEEIQATGKPLAV